MQVGISAQVTGPDGAAFVADAERLGAASVWVPEVWGQDALTPLAYLAARTTTIRLGSAIAALGARTPAMLAMSAMSLQLLSGGRFLLGLGTSGPQVMEGWHGVRFRSPLAVTRETIDIVRAVARGDRLSYAGRGHRAAAAGTPGRRS
jgi:alkanesulfonate monooxygenase SsuD/methylene tetrahydromethanopterin reductase-like flavin-dependent oxidoreductase (luciferase family)